MLFLVLRVQRYKYFLNPANFCTFFWSIKIKGVILHTVMPLCNNK